MKADTEPVPGYRLLAKIDEGLSDEVWKAVGPGGIPIALKFSRMAPGIDPRRSLEIRRVMSEGGFPTLFGSWTRADGLIVGMELAEGSVADAVHSARSRGRQGLSSALALRYLAQAARAIDLLNQPSHRFEGREEVAFRHGSIGAKTLLVINGRISLGGLGSVRTGGEPAPDPMSLDPAFLSPDLILGETNRWSDQYSLAATYCFMRSGRAIFDGDRMQVLKSHCLEVPSLAMLPVAERAVVSRALAKTPGDRWPDCRTFVRELRRSRVMRRTRLKGVRLGNVQPSSVAASEPIAALEIPRSRPERKPSRKTWTMIRAGLLLLLALGVILIPPEESKFGSQVYPPALDRLIRADVVADRERTLAPEPVRSSAEIVVPERVLSRVVPRPVVAALPVLKSSRPPLQDVKIAMVQPRPPVGSARALPRPIVEPIRPVVRDLIPRPTVAAMPKLVAAASPSPRGARGATIRVAMPGPRSELIVRGSVGRGELGEWFGNTRVVHTTPLSQPADYLLGTFMPDPKGKTRSRTLRLRVQPGRVYEVDLKSPQPTSREIRD